MLRLFLFLLTFLGMIEAQTLVVGEASSYRVLPHYTYSAVKDMEEIPSDLDNNVWVKNKRDLALNQTHQGYWLRVKVKNSRDGLKELYLLDERRYVVSIEYYLVKDKQIVVYKKDGFHQRGNVSSFNASQRVFPLPLGVSEEAELFFKVQNYNMQDIPFKIVTKDYMVEYFQTYSFLQGAFFAILLVMALYNLIIYFIVKFKGYLYYIAYLFLLILFQGSYFGYLNQYGIEPLWILFSIVFGGIGFMMAALFFIKELFDLKRYLPTVDKVFSSIGWYFLAVMIINFVCIYLEEFYWSELAYNLISLITPLYVSLLLLSLYYLAYKSVDKMAIWYAIVWSIVSALGLLLIAMHSSFISTEMGIEYLFEAGMILETLLFSLMLAFRIKEIEREKQEQQLLLVQQNRLVSMGEMIVNIAHQWRQPLSEINGQVLNIDLDYRKKVLTDKRMDSYLDSIENITAYMSDTVNDFMNFFNTNKVIEEFMLSDVINQSKKMALMSLSKEIEIVMNVDEHILMLGYKSELIQALLIAINNGVDACDDCVQISIDAIEKEEQVVISIKDNGGGVPSNILPYIFDPYFTTKHQSQGTGLGLYILKMIVEKSMQGKVRMENHTDGAMCLIEIPKRLIKSNRFS